MQPTFNIELTEADLVLLGQLLPEHPYKLVAPLLDKINGQIQQQLKARGDTNG